MEQDWAERVRKYRRRAGLTQEQLADLFLVEPRTIRRWEAGQTRPPLEVRQRLHRNAVPVLQRPEVAALTSLVTSSGEGMMLLDERLNVLAASARDRAWFQSQIGRDPVGLSLEPFLPVAIRDLLGQYGGWEKAVQAGLASFATDFAMQRREIGNSSDFVGRMQHTILRMGDGVRLHLSRSRTLEASQALSAPELTFVDEIMTEG
jgi:transcriptional regulator with XRE-family HTH domain